MRLLAVLGCAALVVLLGAGAAAAQEDGREVYEAKCSACHQSGGAGVPGSFPPLAGNPAAADAAYVETVVREGLSGPLEVLGEMYDGVMAPVDLSDAELAAVVAYVQTLAEATQPAPPPPPEDTPATADAGRGHDLFTGATRLENGGPACHACHSAGSVGFRGGSGLGPDLTGTFAAFGGEAGLTAWLADPPSETMRPLFADDPVTAAEAADLAAFFADVADEEPEGGIDQLWLAGVGGLVVLLALMATVIRGPRKSYAERLRRG